MKYPLVTIPLAALLVLTGCSSGSSSGGDDAPATTPNPPPPPAVAPTVTLTAPATAIANVPFEITWSSTDATSCTGDGFSTGNATSNTISQTATTVGDVTYTITCTGASGTTPATAEQTVTVSAQATAEGLWQGTSTTGSDTRNVAGVVTKENNYWLVYSGLVGSSDEDQGVGFYTGAANVAISANGLSGNLTSPSGLREFNFEGGEAGGGSFSATFDKSASAKSQFTLAGTATSTSLSATHTFGGELQGYTIDGFPPSDVILITDPTPLEFDDNDSPTGIVLVDTAGTTPTGVEGTLRFIGSSASIGVDITGLGLVTLNYPNRALQFAGARNTTWDPATRVMKITNVEFQEMGGAPSCDDGPAAGAYCPFVPVSNSHGDLEITFAGAQGDPLTSYTGVAHLFQIIEELVDPAAVPGCSTNPNISPAGENACANATLTFSGTIPSSPSTSQTIATTYDETYELVPSLSDLLGSYSGSDGVNTTLNSGSTFDVALDGTVTATAEAGACAITGTVVPHLTGGNVYDATLEFANGTGTCSYSGAFNGVLVRDATDPSQPEITVTAVESVTAPALPTKGFLFTGSVAQ